MTTASTTTASTTATATPKSAPAYEAFVGQLVALCKELDVPVNVTSIKSWVCLESTANKHKLYVPKSAEQMSLCETTLPLPDATPGRAPLPKPNGKIQCRFASDLDLLAEHVLPLMASSQERLPANRKPAKKATPGAAAGETAPIHGLSDDDLEYELEG